MGVRDPLVSDRLVPLAVAPLRLVAATIPRAATGTLVGPCCLRCADGWGGAGAERSEVQQLFKFPVETQASCPCARPLTEGVTTSRGLFMKIIDSLKPASISVQLVCVSVNPGSGKHVLWARCCSCYY